MVSALMKHSLRAGDKAVISAGTEVPWDTPSSRTPAKTRTQSYKRQELSSKLEPAPGGTPEKLLGFFSCKVGITILNLPTLSNVSNVFC